MLQNAKTRAAALLLSALLLLSSPVQAATASGAARHSGDGSTWLGVAQIDQNPELPNGCEVTSLAILLNYYGFAASKTDLADYYLQKQPRYTDNRGREWGGDPETVYPGNPRDDTGWYCFAEPLAAAANRYLSDARGGYTAVDATGATLDELLGYIDDGHPVAVWLTVDGAAPKPSETAAWRTAEGGILVPYVNVHCAVLSGYTSSALLLSDPLNTIAGMARPDFEAVYGALGSRALVLVENTGL